MEIVKNVLLLIDNQEKVVTFFKTIPIYVYFIIIIILSIILYFYFKNKFSNTQKSNIKIVSWWAVNIEWNKNSVCNIINK